MKTLLLSAALISTTLALTSCKTADEMDDINKAQSCLNAVPQSAPTNASGCLQYVEKYNSQQANILKCSIYMTAGGLIESKVVASYEALEDNSLQNKEATFMSLLALEPSPFGDGLTTATKANEYCQATGVSGLTYISGLIVAGSYMTTTMAALGVPIDINNPNVAVANLVDQCTDEGGGVAPACAQNVEALASAVVMLSETYCATEDADDDVCSDINDAVAAAGAEPEDIGRALFCYMENPSRGYNPTTNLCI